MTETKSLKITELKDDELDMVSGGVNIPAETGEGADNDPSSNSSIEKTKELFLNGARHWE